MSSQIHVVSKRDVSNHINVPISTAPPALGPSSVRTLTKLISLSRNNITYAVAGNALGWWSTYPVPSTLPSPYTDRGQWGIVPAWGFAEVVESSTAIPKGSTIFGLWPISSYYHDLKLDAIEPQGHFRETSDHRQVLMNLYNRYIVIDQPLSNEFKAWSAFPVLGTGFLLNRFCFPSDSRDPIHPLGDGHWTKEDADLTSTVVIGLSTSSKTGRSFSWNMIRNRGPENIPLAYVQVSSSASSLGQPTTTHCNIKDIDYDDIDTEATLAWISAMNPHRVLFIDFGAKEGAVKRALNSLVVALPESTTFGFIAVGTGFDLIERLELSKGRSQGRKISWAQCNHSSLQDAAMNAVSAAVVYEELSSALKKWLADGGPGDMKLVYRSGVGSMTSVERAWSNLCAGNISPQDALLFELE